MSKPETSETPANDLTKDLQEIIKDARSKALHQSRSFKNMTKFEYSLKLDAAFDHYLLEDLAIYITARDNKVMTHGVDVGIKHAERKQSDRS